MKLVQILGTGCEKCNRLAATAEAAARSAGVPFTIEKITELRKIMSFGVMSTPALVVDGKVMASGRVPSLEEITKMLVEPTPAKP